MGMEQIKTAAETNQSGRDFLTVRENLDDNSPQELKKTIEKGDYINMPGIVFKKWISNIPVKNKEALEALSEMDEIKVEVKEVVIKKADEFCDENIELVVEGGGIQKKVLSSLFYNYGTQGGNRNKEIIYDTVVGFNEKSPDIDIRK